jgi:hypothetical protein
MTRKSTPVRMTDVVNRADVTMTQCGDRLRLALEPPASLGALSQVARKT